MTDKNYTSTRISLEQLEKIKDRARIGNRSIVRELTAVIEAGLSASNQR